MRIRKQSLASCLKNTIITYIKWKGFNSVKITFEQGHNFKTFLVEHCIQIFMS